MSFWPEELEKKGPLELENMGEIPERRELQKGNLFLEPARILGLPPRCTCLEQAQRNSNRVENEATVNHHLNLRLTPEQYMHRQTKQHSKGCKTNIGTNLHSETKLTEPTWVVCLLKQKERYIFPENFNKNQNFTI